LLSFVVVLAVTGFVSAGLGDWFGKITGRVTSNPVNVNITVADTVAPVISTVNTISAVTLNEGPSSTSVVINFSASDSSNLNDTSALINLTRSGEAVRANTTCVKIASVGGTIANYSCTIIFYWFDGAGSWNITASVKDISGNLGMNVTPITVNALTGFVSAPAALTWAAIIPGSNNQTSSNDPVLMNNTGNQDITAGNVQLNTTNLKGEVDNTKALTAGNFSVGVTTGGSPPAECGATTMASSVYTARGSATLPHGNFTVNDGSTGQEQVYFCLKHAGTELTSQAYSTANMGAWTLKIA
jgi:hypothetical protein